MAQIRAIGYGATEVVDSLAGYIQDKIKNDHDVTNFIGLFEINTIVFLFAFILLRNLDNLIKCKIYNLNEQVEVIEVTSYMKKYN